MSFLRRNKTNTANAADQAARRVLTPAEVADCKEFGLDPVVVASLVMGFESALPAKSTALSNLRSNAA